MIKKLSVNQSATWCKWAILLFLALSFSIARAESIESFSTHNTIKADGTVVVEETILYDFEGESRHGIYRTLETGHPQAATKKFYDRFIDIEVVDVSLGGEAVPYEVTSGNEVVIKIGDPDEFVTGKIEYQITYKLSGALSYGTEGAEFYYDVTGNNWEVPIGQVVAVVVGEKEGLLREKIYCYEGSLGSTKTCLDKISTQSATTFMSGPLGAGEGLTIAQEVDTAHVAELVAQRSSLAWLLWVVALIWAAGFLWWALSFRGRNQISRPVIAQYEPYAGFLPMYTGVLFDNSLDPKDITAGIVYLAEQGFISIKKTDKKVLWVFSTTDYEITLKKLPVEIQNIFLQKILGLLFEGSAQIGAVVPISELARERNKNALIVKSLGEDVLKDLKEQGFLDSQLRYVLLTAVKAFVGVWTVTFAVLLAFGLLENVGLAGMAIPVVFAAAATGVQLAVATFNRRSKKGYEALNHLEGFKLFLSVTDKERFDFHNAPEKSPELFMKYLPYAIALGVEEKWAKVFEGITIPNPDWYDGGNVAAFSAVALTSDVSAFSTSFASSSGTSGSSGGGSSGGGGGGGGGGSW